MPRMVMCAKLGRELPGLEAPPFPGEQEGGTGKVVAKIDAMIPVLNPKGGTTMLRKEMEEFFFGEDAQLPEGWVAPGAGAPAKGGGPRKK